MSSTTALRACMQVLVLLNLVFVQMTGAASLSGLVPLYLLTLIAPLLHRFAGHRGYQTVWNLLVVATFGILILAVSQGDLGNVLEYGLLLAVLCQVHLLNNLRSDQRPDLLFFNAFLIAVVAGYINRGSTFGLVFLAFAPAFVMGLQLLAATAEGQVPSRVATQRLVRDGALRSGALIALSLLVFVFWPRNFERKAFFHGRLDFSSEDDADASVGFTDVLTHKKRKAVTAQNKPALRVSVLEGDSNLVSGLWRGALLGATDGSGWRPINQRYLRTGGDAEPGWQSMDGGYRRPWDEPEVGAVLRVQRLDTETRHLFTTLETYGVHVTPDGTEALMPQRDNTFQTPGKGKFDYEVVIPVEESTLADGRFEDCLPRELTPYVALPRSRRLDSAVALATSLVPSPQSMPQNQVVGILANYLRENYAYLPPGSPDAPESLSDFLHSKSGGHCELFASSLATMLRSLEIPCRIATGYRSDAWDGAKRTLTFSQRDAHAWVEVFDPAAGWVCIDPTPPSVFAKAEPGFFARLSAQIRSAWNAVTGFDNEARAELFAWARTLPKRAASFLSNHPLASLATLFLTFALVSLVRRNRHREPLPVREYRAALERSKLIPRPGETPRELLQRAEEEGLDPVDLARLRNATMSHEQQRYAQAA